MKYDENQIIRASSFSVIDEDKNYLDVESIGSFLINARKEEDRDNYFMQKTSDVILVQISAKKEMKLVGEMSVAVTIKKLL